MIENLAQIGVVAGSLSGALILMLILSRYPWIVFLLATIYVAISWEIPQVAPLLYVSGSAVYLLDVVCVELMILACFNLRYLLRSNHLALLMFLAIATLLGFSLIRGISANRIGDAVNDFRSFMYPFSMTIWALSIKWTSKRKAGLLRFGLILGWVLVAVAVYHVAKYGLGTASGFVTVAADDEQTSRALLAGQALMLLVASILTLQAWAKTRSLALLLSVGCFAIVIVVTQQRTVWAAAVVVIAVALLRGTNSTRLRLLVSGFFVVLAGALAIAAGSLNSFFATIAASAANSRTYSGREEGWVDLIQRSTSQGISAIIFGSPFGIGYGRIQSGTWVTWAAHNWYVTSYLRIGIVGLFLVGATMIGAIAISWQRRRLGSLAMCSALLTYGWAYSWPWYACLVAAAIYAVGSGSSYPDTTPIRRESRIRGSQLMRS